MELACNTNHMTTDSDLLDIANSSGFPLQIAVEHLVRNDPENFWRIRHIEHAWKSPDDDLSGFIDLVIEDAHPAAILVFECKRVRDSSWVFLRPDGTYNNRRWCMSWVSSYIGGKFKCFGWGNVPVDPASPEAIFCAVRGQPASGSRPMLERVAGELVAATEALAMDEQDFRPKNFDSVSFYFSVLVTTATLHLCEFAPEQISISDGTLPDAKFTEVPYLRFRKQLSLRAQPLTLEHFEENRPLTSNEHTVFVVNILGLREFLNKFELPTSSTRRYV